MHKSVDLNAQVCGFKFQEKKLDEPKYIQSTKTRRTQIYISTKTRRTQIYTKYNN
jgi:hypothetical protein